MNNTNGTGSSPGEAKGLGNIVGSHNRQKIYQPAGYLHNMSNQQYREYTL